MAARTVASRSTTAVVLLIVSARLGGERLPDPGDRRHRAGPADVERQVRDHLDELVLGDPVLDRAREVKAHLLGLAGRDERRAGDEAAVALGQLRPLPD